MLKQKLYEYARLMRWDKPVGKLLLLWPTLWGVWAASDGQPKIEVICIFILGVWVMSSAGCVINDYADRNFDGHVQRTAQRPLARKAVSEKEAIILFLGLLAIAFILLLFLNRNTQLMAVAAAALATLYPFMKRFTYWPQLVLGIAYSWGILMAYVEQTNSLSLYAGILFLAGVSWTLVYDTFYALVDKEDDLKIGIKSTAILFGENIQLIITLLQGLTLISLICFGWLMNYKPIYFVMLFFAAILAVYQLYLMRDVNRCFKAFVNNNWYGLLVFIGIFLNYYQGI